MKYNLYIIKNNMLFTILYAYSKHNFYFYTRKINLNAQELFKINKPK